MKTTEIKEVLAILPGEQQTPDKASGMRLAVYNT
jgi:hypothetical protein